MKSKKNKKQYRPIYMAVLLVIALIITVLAGLKIIADQSNLAVTKQAEVKAVLKSAKLENTEPKKGVKIKLVNTEITITNSTPETIGLDINGCGYKVLLNGKEVNSFQSVGNYGFGCTEMAGTINIKPGEKHTTKPKHSIQQAKVGDKIKMVYKYIILKDGEYRYFDVYSDSNPEVVSNEIIIK